jgi:hypothetical protein
MEGQISVTALQVPEIIINIGSFLDRNSLAKGTQVCQSWKQLWTPLLFMVIDGGHSQPSKQALVQLHTISATSSLT